MKNSCTGSGTAKLQYSKYLHSIAVKFIFAVIIYAMLLSTNLVNYADGIWDGPDWMAGNIELSSGRWMLRYLDMLRWGISVNPLSSLLSLLFYTIGTELFVVLMQLDIGCFLDYLVSFLFLGNTVVCVTLSYPYTSNAYGIAFILSVLCVILIVRGSKKIEEKGRKLLFFLEIIGATVCLVLVMGIYQGYLGCITLLLLACMILQILRKAPAQRIRNLLLGGSITGIAGLIIYESVLHTELKRYQVVLSDYKGGSSISLDTVISAFWPSVKKAYAEIYHYFMGGGSVRWNMFVGKKLAIALIILLGCALLFIVPKLFVYNKFYILLVVIGIGLFPLAADITQILAPESGMLPQQSAPMSLILPVIFALISQLDRECKTKEIIVDIFALVLLWGSVWQVQIDQQAMREGTTAATSIAQDIVTTLSCEKMLGAEKSYAFIGSPSGNPLFYASSLYPQSNSYARIAGPYWGGYLDHWTWRGLYQHKLGINMPICSDGKYLELLHSETVAQMPLYPEDGSIKVLDDIIVIKVSENN